MNAFFHISSWPPTYWKRLDPRRPCIVAFQDLAIHLTYDIGGFYMGEMLSDTEYYFARELPQAHLFVQANPRCSISLFSLV